MSDKNEETLDIDGKKGRIEDITQQVISWLVLILLLLLLLLY
jgi:hypothetical protein